MENIKFLKKVYRMFFSMSKEQEKLEYIKEQSKVNIIDRYNFYKEYIR